MASSKRRSTVTLGYDCLQSERTYMKAFGSNEASDKAAHCFGSPVEEKRIINPGSKEEMEKIIRAERDKLKFRGFFIFRIGES